MVNNGSEPFTTHYAYHSVVHWTLFAPSSHRTPMAVHELAIRCVSNVDHPRARIHLFAVHDLALCILPKHGWRDLELVAVVVLDSGSDSRLVFVLKYRRHLP